MHTALESAHAWFFDSASHNLNGELVVRLVEGIKGKEREFVDVGETKLGPYFPVRVEASSRCAQVTFLNAISFFSYYESYDRADPALKKDSGRFLFTAESSSFRTFVETRTNLAELQQGSYSEYLLCCEDRIFHVLATEVPLVSLLQIEPNLAVQRTNTWSAS